MKKIAYIIFFFVLSVCFVMVYYAGYYYATKKLDQGDAVIYSNTDGTNSSLDDDVKSVDLDGEEIITKDTEYILESYNLTNDELKKETFTIPVALIGLNREEVINYISKNTDEFTNEGEEIRNVQLISFSSNSIVLRKSFSNIETTEYKYWLKDVDGYIIVYKADKTTVYFNTNISTSTLPAEEKEQLEEGKYIKDIHELYNFLESFTS